VPTENLTLNKLLIYLELGRFPLKSECRQQQKRNTRLVAYAEEKVRASRECPSSLRKARLKMGTRGFGL
jgi:hypothetical protein